VLALAKMKHACFALSLGAASLVLGVAPSAFAQDAEVGEASPPPASMSASPAPASAPTENLNVDESKKDSAHFRFGMGLDADYLLAPSPTSLQGLGAGLQVRLGVQINSWCATYYQAHAVIGGTVQGSGLETNATLIGAVFNSVLFEATLPVLHVGAGPSVDVLGVRGFSLQGGETASTTASFGLDGRAAIVIGGHGPGRHAGFDIEANVHPTFWNGIVLTTFSVGIGGEMY
jgi:hypothetical protein